MIVSILWSLLALNLLVRLRAYRSLKPVEGPVPEGLPAIDVIVPARNEEAVFEPSLGSILDQDYPSFRVIAVDDESTDGTLAILRRMSEVDARIVVVEGRPRPGGWVGKTWAVDQGYRRSEADWLAFIDADMGLHPRALLTAMVAAERERADLVSFMPRVECRTFWQGAIAVSFLQVLVQLYPLDRVNEPRSRMAIAAGGFILVRRAAYERAGGHEAGRHDIVDDIKLARRVKAMGGRLFVRVAPDLGWTHMYGTFRDIWRGLRKNAYAGMDYKFYKFAFGMVGAMLLAWGPAFAIARGLAGGSVSRVAVGIWGVLAQAAASLPLAIFLRVNPLYCFAVPLGITAYAAIAASSVWHHHRGRILWKGRAIPSAEVEAAEAAGRT